MISRELHIVNKLGLHARAAAKFVQTASAYTSTIVVRRKGREVNGKSIMGLMMLAAARGATIEVAIDGVDEDAALEALASLVADRFGEAQ